MIKPGTTLVLYIIVLILVYLFLPWKGIFFIIISILFLIHLVYCSANICSQAYIKTLCKIKTSEKKIAITFDDGPDSKITPKVLEILDEYNAKATFFCIGKNIENNKDLLKLIDEKGHLTGNHTWSHDRWFDLFSSKKMKSEIEKTSDLIFEIISKKPKLFRPPYGVTNPVLKRALKNINFHTIGWSIRSFDTINSPEKTLKRIKNKLSPGDIILFHDNREHIIEILKSFLEYTNNQGYQIVRLDKLLNIEAYEI
ncbi:MAG: polysaccharide deacetylase family protein [Bacteroidales bacterium]|nr:polysaccharide deacetylase family protein [Bacteroidales bacterium]